VAQPPSAVLLVRYGYNDNIHEATDTSRILSWLGGQWPEDRDREASRHERRGSVTCKGPLRPSWNLAPASLTQECTTITDRA